MQAEWEKRCKSEIELNITESIQFLHQFLHHSTSYLKMVRDGPGWSGCSHLKATALRQDSLEAGDVKTSLERLGTQDLHRSDQKIPEVAFKLESQMLRS